MSTPDGGRIYDLEERTAVFAERVRAFVKTLPRTIANIEDIKQGARRVRSGRITAKRMKR